MCFIFFFSIQYMKQYNNDMFGSKIRVAFVYIRNLIKILFLYSINYKLLQEKANVYFLLSLIFLSNNINKKFKCN